MLGQHFSNVQVMELTGLVVIISNADLMYSALHLPMESPAEIATLNGAVAVNAGRIKTHLQGVLVNWPQQWLALDAGRANSGSAGSRTDNRGAAT